jgi:branched-chain amino acid transport system ATP-binding protein
MSSFALELQGIHHRFGSTAVLAGVDLQVRAGERLALIGPNGAGKSTLFNLISGEMQASQGQILLFGQRVAGWTTAQIHRAGLARSFQIQRLFGGLTVSENLASGLQWQAQPAYRCCGRQEQQAQVQAQVMHWLEQLDLKAQARLRADQLNYAQQRRLELGLALSSAQRVVLLDEPTAGMSRAEAQLAVALIRDCTQDKTLLMVEHDMDVVFELADRVAVLEQGRILACDTPLAVRANPQVQEAYLGAMLSNSSDGGAHA